LRGTIFNLTLTLLFDYPLIQCVIMNLINFLMFGYLLNLRPLKNMLATIQLFVNEGLMNALMICVLILASMDKAGISGEKTRAEVGTVILIIIQAFSIFAIVFMGISILVFMVSTYKKWRYLKAHKTKPNSVKILKMLIFGSPKNKIQKTIPDISSSLDSQRVFETTLTTIPQQKFIQKQVCHLNSNDMSIPSKRISIVSDMDNLVNSQRSILGDLDSSGSFYLGKGRRISDIQFSERKQENSSSQTLNIGRENTEIGLFTNPDIRIRARDSLIQSWKRVKDRLRRSENKALEN